MASAFEKFKEIFSMDDIILKHREWLKDYEGLQFGKALEGKNITTWKNTKYKDSKFSTDINLIGERKDRLKIEFDGNKSKAQNYLLETENKLVEKGWGYIKTTHGGKSDYLWIEFTENLTDKQKESFLLWIAPEGSEIDLNFASSNRIFPVMFAVHRKHSYNREIPIVFKEGEKIDFSALNIQERPGKKHIQRNGYTTFKAGKIFTRIGQAEEFVRSQPLFYDRARLWWIWNKNENYWEISDDRDILNMISDELNLDVVPTKVKNEIITALQLVGRKNTPKEAKKTWIQFKNGIVDLDNINEIILPNPNYFITNPISWNLGESDSTPVMDKLFEEWVGKDYVKTLYQILAYSILPSYPIHRIFCFIGGGMNGKSCFLNLLRKFVGSKNVTSTELDTLLNSRFEVSRLFKKLVCQMGETNFSEMNKTSMLKKLSGGDLIGFEYKRKDPFEAENYAKIVIATNNLPTTSDKTIGFYRRWLIVDFPNQFTEKKNVLAMIPDREYENLGRKCLNLLKELLETKEFHKEGTLNERIKKYEDKSDPLGKFINEFTIEDANGFIWKWEFEKRLNEWCKENRFREISDVMIGRKMKEKGITQELRYVDWTKSKYGESKRIRAWYGLKWSELNEPFVKSSFNSGSTGNGGSFLSTTIKMNKMNK